MKIQAKALVKMISAALEVLNDSSVLSDALTDLAKRHFGYGVIATQYSVVGEVLLWTLGKVLGENFTPDVQLSWLTVYNSMLKIIIPVAVTEERKAFVEAEKNGKKSIKNTLAAGISVSM